jgi:TonB family protein
MLAAAAAAALWTSYAEAQAPEQHRAVITNPDWVRLPSAYDLSRYYPTGVTTTGRAVITCSVLASGILADCSVISESPPNSGFGEAALKMTTLFQMKPAQRDGRPVGGATVTIPINFSGQGRSIEPRLASPVSQDELDAVWPDAGRGMPGQVFLDCTTSSQGVLSHCSVQSEQPTGHGFGGAALALAPKIALAPGAGARRIVPGRVIVPVTFTLPKPKQNGVARFGEALAALRNAPWSEAPSAADVAAAWPKSAPSGLAAGSAKLSCRLTSSGRLDPCDVTGEDPPGIGFGAAAMALRLRFSTSVSGIAAESLARTRLNLSFAFTNPARGSSAPQWITEPNWLAFIDADTMTSLYPQAASQAKVDTGRGIVKCVIDRTGALTACQVDGEDPPGLGFGPAAVAAAGAFKVNLWTDDGRPVDGAKIRMPIRFVAADPEPPASAPGAKPGG